MKYTGERLVPEQNYGQEVYLEHMVRYEFASDFVKNKDVLDIASGSGYGSFLLSQSKAKSVVGVDISAEAIKYSKGTYKNKNLEYLVGSVSNIPVQNASMDVIISFETIEHVDKATQEQFLREIKRCLKPKGVLIISTPNKKLSPKGNEFHLRELTKNEFETLLGSEFKKAKLFSQNSIMSGYVAGDTTSMLDELPTFLDNARIVALKSRERVPEQYYIAVCSNADLTKDSTSFVISDIDYLSIYREHQETFMKRLEAETKQQQERNKELEKENMRLSQWIAELKGRKIWRLLSLIMKEKLR